MPIAGINNIDCYYEVHGSGRPLILIAGLASDSQSWQSLLSGLAKNFKLIIFDNRGVGRTRYPPESFQISTLATDAVCLLDALAIDKVGIFGHSMGGCIAQEIAIEYPQRVKRLILANTSAALSSKNKLLFNDLLKILGSGNYELFIRKFFSLIFTPDYLGNKGLIESVVNAALDYSFLTTADGFKRQLEALSHFNSLDRLKNIKAETLILAGEEDVLVNVEEAQLLSQAIPFSKFLCLKNVAHSFHAENSELFINKISEFLLTNG